MGSTAPPFLGDDIFVLIASHLDVRSLGRLARAAARFSVKEITQRRSVAEEGARRQVAAQSRVVQGWVCAGLPWLRRLAKLRTLLGPLAFTDCGPGVELGEVGALARKDGCIKQSSRRSAAARR